MATTTHPEHASCLHGNGPLDSPSNIPSLTPASTLGSSYDTSSPSHYHICDDVLEDSVFPELKKNEESDVSELQKEDPMGIYMWKFYRNQSNVPDAGRMENMTWRMMAINLRKSQQKKESARAAVGHVRAPDAEHWSSPTTAKQEITTRRIANPRTASHDETSWKAPVKSEGLGDFQFSFTSHLSQTPQDPAHFQTPFEYSASNGPRGHIQMPDGLKHEPGLPGLHARHVSLDAGYPDDSFDTKPDFTHVQNASGGNVAPWDPGWAEEAFGGQSLYDTPQVKKEEIEHEHSFDADGYLLPDNWITQDAPQGFGGQTSRLNHHATAQSLLQWQHFEESHYSELSGQRPRLRTQPDQYGQMFTASGFDLSDSSAITQSSTNHQAIHPSQTPSSRTMGRKRRKER